MKALLVVIVCASACASAKKAEDAPRASHEIVSGAGRVHGGGLRMDVAVGHSFAQHPVKGSGSKLTSASPVVR